MSSDILSSGGRLPGSEQRTSAMFDFLTRLRVYTDSWDIVQDKADCSPEELLSALEASTGIIDWQNQNASAAPRAADIDIGKELGGDQGLLRPWHARASEKIGDFTVSQTVRMLKHMAVLTDHGLAMDKDFLALAQVHTESHFRQTFNRLFQNNRAAPFANDEDTLRMWKGVAESFGQLGKPLPTGSYLRKMVQRYTGECLREPSRVYSLSYSGGQLSGGPAQG